MAVVSVGRKVSRMGDLISRQAVKDIMFNRRGVRIYTHKGEKLKRYAEIDLDDFDAIPSAQSEHMHTVMLKIAEKYEKAMNTSCILNPMAWALYQTWKEYDR